MEEGAEVAHRGGGSAREEGKEVDEDRGSRCSGKGTRTHLWIFFSFKGKGKAQVDSSTWRPHKAKDTWAPDQVETGQIGQTT